MVNYEVALIVRPLARADLVKSLKRICTTIMQQGSIIKGMENLGENRLAYKISAHDERFHIGRHIVLDVESPPTSVLPLRQTLKLDSDVIRVTALNKNKTYYRLGMMKAYYCILSLLYIHFHTTTGTDYVFDGPLYKQQVVVVLDMNITIQQTGKLLCQRHETLCHVLMWNSTTKKLDNAEWNSSIGRYETVQNSNLVLPIGDCKPFSWSETRVQVLGQGEEQSETISGFLAENLVEMILENFSDGNISHISIIANSINSEVYLTKFMNQLQHLRQFETSTSLSSAIAWTDHSGRNLVGELLSGTNGTVLRWRHASFPNAWIGYFTGQNFQVHQAVMSAGSLEMRPSAFGVLPEGVESYVTSFSSPPSRHSTYEIADSTAFDWVDLVAKKMYKNKNTVRAISSAQQVLFLSGSQTTSEVDVIKTKNMLEVIEEMRYYGNKGPADDDAKVYYRFGDWVLSMNETSFDVKVVGIIVSHNDTNEKKAKVDSIRKEWQEMPDNYPDMQQATSSRFFDNVAHWINGKHGEIDLSLETAYNAQCGLSMFLSESIRSFHTHITNMMCLDLAQTGYLTKEYFFSSHPMAQVGTWQIKDPRTGKKKTGLSSLCDNQARAGLFPDKGIQQAFNGTLLRISRITKSWLSHVNSTVMGSRYVPPATNMKKLALSELANVLSVVDDIGLTSPGSQTHLRVFELTESATRLLSSSLSEPELGAIDTQLQNFSAIDYHTLPLQASIALVNDHAYFSDLVYSELNQLEEKTGKKYEIVPESLEISEKNGTLQFFVCELGNVSSELQTVKTVCDLSKLQSKKLLENLFYLSDKTKPIGKWFKLQDSVKFSVLSLNLKTALN